jgi:hypothetical protein
MRRFSFNFNFILLFLHLFTYTCIHYLGHLPTPQLNDFLNDLCRFLLPYDLNGIFLSFFLFCNTWVWTQGVMLARQAVLQLEPLHQPFFVLGPIPSLYTGSPTKLFVRGWLWTRILLISASCKDYRHESPVPSSDQTLFCASVCDIWALLRYQLVLTILGGFTMLPCWSGLWSRFSLGESANC